MSGLLGRLVVLLGADVGTLESDMGKAVRVAERKTKEIERTARTAGKAVGEIGHVLATANFGGLEKLTDSSRTATAAVKGLGASLTLIGFASWPVVAIAGAAGALAYFAGSSSQAEREAEELSKRLDQLRMSAEQLAIAPIQTDLLEAGKKRMEAEEQLISARERLGRLQSGELSWGAIFQIPALQKKVDELASELATWVRGEEAAGKAIADIRGKYAGETPAAKGLEAVKRFREGIERQLVTLNGGAVAAAKFTLAQEDMVKSIREGGEAARAEADAAIAAATAIDSKTEADKRQRAAEKAKKEAIEEATRAMGEQAKLIDASFSLAVEKAKSAVDEIAVFNLEVAKLEGQLSRGEISAIDMEMGIERLTRALKDHLGKEVEETGRQINVFAEEAGRNIHNIVAGLLKGAGSAESFFKSMVDGLKDVAAELATSGLLEMLFSSFLDDDGFMGNFARAATGKRAGGGSVEKGGLYEVNEYRPEMLSVGGRDFLLMGAQAGRVNANPKGIGGAPTAVFNPVINVAAGLTHAEAYNGTMLALAEFKRQFVRDLERGKLTSVT